jgi:hypothetical protein
MKTKLILLLTCYFLFIGCTKQKVKKDLNSRYTKFEIVEIKHDVANVKKAFLDYLDASMIVAENSSKISSIVSDYLQGKQYWTIQQYSLTLDGLYDTMEKKLLAFEKSEKTVESCIYVKYRIPDGVKKVEKEEYYVFDGKKVYRRPKDWDEWLTEIHYGTIVDLALYNHTDINEIRSKATRLK